MFYYNHKYERKFLYKEKDKVISFLIWSLAFILVSTTCKTNNNIELSCFYKSK